MQVEYWSLINAGLQWQQSLRRNRPFVLGYTEFTRHRFGNCRACLEWLLRPRWTFHPLILQGKATSFVNHSFYSSSRPNTHLLDSSNNHPQSVLLETTQSERRYSSFQLYKLSLYLKKKKNGRLLKRHFQPHVQKGSYRNPSGWQHTATTIVTLQLLSPRLDVNEIGIAQRE